VNLKFALAHADGGGRFWGWQPQAADHHTRIFQRIAPGFPRCPVGGGFFRIIAEVTFRLRFGTQDDKFHKYIAEQIIGSPCGSKVHS
jgi:hypothetical protein